MRQLRRLPGKLSCAASDAVLGEDDVRPVERVGLEDIGASFEVRLMDGERNPFAVGVEHLVATEELFAAEVFGGRAECFEGGAGGSVGDENALRQKVGQLSAGEKVLGMGEGHTDRFRVK